MDKIYKKVGNRYKEIGIEFAGFPANGIWFVKDGHNSLMIHLDNIKDNMSIPLLDYLKYKNDLTDYVVQKSENGISINELCKLACEYFAKIADGEIVKKDKRW